MSGTRLRYDASADVSLRAGQELLQGAGGGRGCPEAIGTSPLTRLAARLGLAGEAIALGAPAGVRLNGGGRGWSGRPTASAVLRSALRVGVAIGSPAVSTGADVVDTERVSLLRAKVVDGTPPRERWALTEGRSVQRVATSL
ncbi:hypothetical protein Emed_007035 [Eimeria media]